jgi:hypothetical protein
MNEHTPGPWRVSERPYAQDEGPVVETPQNIYIATASPIHGGPMPGNPYERAVANARLIAAAPELLEALEDALPDLLSFYSFMSPEEDDALASLNQVGK